MTSVPPGYARFVREHAFVVRKWKTRRSGFYKSTCRLKVKLWPRVALIRAIIGGERAAWVTCALFRLIKPIGACWEMHCGRWEINHHVQSGKNHFFPLCSNFLTHGAAQWADRHHDERVWWFLLDETQIGNTWICSYLCSCALWPNDWDFWILKMFFSYRHECTQCNTNSLAYFIKQAIQSPLIKLIPSHTELHGCESNIIKQHQLLEKHNLIKAEPHFQLYKHLY